MYSYFNDLVLEVSLYPDEQKHFIEQKFNSRLVETSKSYLYTFSIYIYKKQKYTISR